MCLYQSAFSLQIFLHPTQSKKLNNSWSSLQCPPLCCAIEGMLKCHGCPKKCQQPTANSNSHRPSPANSPIIHCKEGSAEEGLQNPGYGRQSISRLMRIVAPIPQYGGPRIPHNPIFLKNRKNHQKHKNSKNLQKYDKISDTPFDQRSLIHREAWFPGGPRIPKNPMFLKNGKNHPKRKKS